MAKNQRSKELYLMKNLSSQGFVWSHTVDEYRVYSYDFLAKTYAHKGRASENHM